MVQIALKVGINRRREQVAFEGIEKRLRSISRREKELFDQLTSGKQTKEIAYNLKIGETTVDFHRRNLLAKMGVSNVVELTRLRDHHEMILAKRGTATAS